MNVPIAAIHGQWHLAPVVPKLAQHADLPQYIAVMKKVSCQVMAKAVASGSDEVVVQAGARAQAMEPAREEA